MNSEPSRDRLFGPDLIRATAIVCVMVSHTLPGLTTFAAVREVRSVLGLVGVEIFFVLSGYLIGGILLKQLFKGGLETVPDLVVFWRRRWFRTLPNYYLFLLLFLALACCTSGNVPAGSGAYFWFGQALLSPHPVFFTVAWSLAVEEWFYLLFPLLLWIFLKVLKARLVAFWITVGFLLTFSPVLRSFATCNDWDAGLRKVALFRLDSIMFGVVLAYIAQRYAAGWAVSRRLWPVGGAMVLGLVAVSHAFTGIEYSFFGRVFYLSSLSLGLSLIFPRVVIMTCPRGLFSGMILRLSLWSYSMYLCHSWLSETFGWFFSYAGWSVHGANAVLLAGLNWVTTLLVSAVIYSWFEQPVMNLREHFSPTRDAGPSDIQARVVR